MDKMKKQIRLQLVANVLKDKCAHREHLIFYDAWCSQERVVRFTTRFLRGLFPSTDLDAGKWKTGDEIMYEVKNGASSCVISCIYAPTGTARLSEGTLASWDITDNDANVMFDRFDALIDKTIPIFEKELAERLKHSDVLTEGEEKIVVSVAFERKPEVRAACLSYHGYTCKICGMSFKDSYGESFKDIIEVHHIVPLCEIRKNYEVDPVKDLVPVCPNCHAALHSKPDGVYSIDEMKKKLR